MLRVKVHATDDVPPVVVVVPPAKSWVRSDKSSSRLKPCSSESVTALAAPLVETMVTTESATIANFFNVLIFYCVTTFLVVSTMKLILSCDTTFLRIICRLLLLPWTCLGVRPQTILSGEKGFCNPKARQSAWGKVGMRGTRKDG